MKPDPAKCEVVKNWPTLRTVHDVRSFLGLCSYYRRFIKNFATIARPLTRLLEAGQKFEWAADCQNAFEPLKLSLTGDEIMAYPNDAGLYILDTDASDTGIGATLSQMQWSDKLQAEVERPVVFASKLLSRAERRYCVTRRELLAVVFFVQRFRHYLLGRKFVIRTDHSALRWVMSFKNPVDQMARWIEVLSQYDFSIEHRPGVKHGNADGLSRVECDPDECQCYDGVTVLSELPCGGCDRCLKKHEQYSSFFEVDECGAFNVQTRGSIGM